MYSLKKMSRTIFCCLALRCSHIYLRRAVHADLYQKLQSFNCSQCAADDKKLTIPSDFLKFTWVHIILFSVVSAFLKTYNPTLIFQTIFHHIFCKQVKWKKRHSMELLKMVLASLLSLELQIVWVSTNILSFFLWRISPPS